MCNDSTDGKTICHPITLGFCSFFFLFMKKILTTVSFYLVLVAHQANMTRRDSIKIIISADGEQDYTFNQESRPNNSLFRRRNSSHDRNVSKIALVRIL